jgi:hypothetical protein
MTFLMAKVMTPWQRLQLHFHSYPLFPRYKVILGALFRPVVAEPPTLKSN